MHSIRRLFAALFLGLSAPSAHACPVCIDLPVNTAADHILGDVIAVLARPSTDDPLRFDIVEILRGNPDDLEWLPEIPYPVTASDRRVFAAQPNASALLTYGAPRADAEDPVSGDTWHRHITVTPERRATIDGIIAEGDGWFWATTSDPDRFAFFAERLTSSDRVLHEMALAELSRAPYRMIRTLGDAVPTQTLRARLTDINAQSFVPINILLLGANTDEVARTFVRDRFAGILPEGDAQLDAWAVAAIEVDRSTAVAQIAEAIASGRLSAVSQSDLVLALSVAGTALEDLRGEISLILKDVAIASPGLAGDVAYAFYEWQDWSMTDHFAALLEGSEIDDATRYILQIVVSAARLSTESEG